MNELILMIQNPTEGQWLKHIDWNKAEFEAAIESAVKNFQNIAYSEDQIKQAKADRADLNKLKKAIDDRRKEVKKTISAPYDQFEKEVKEVTQKLDSAIAQIDEQVKASESKQKEEKKRQIVHYFMDTLTNEGLSKIHLEKLCDASWLNASTSMAQIKKAIDAKVLNLKNGYSFCNNLPDDERTLATMTFEKDYDIGEAISEVNLYRQKKAVAEESKRQEENQRKLAEMVKEPAQDEEADSASNEPACDTIEEPVDTVHAVAEQGAEEKVIKTISVPFNGTNLDYILGALRGIVMPKRGIINLSLLGTEQQIDSVLKKLGDSGVKFKVPDQESGN